MPDYEFAVWCGAAYGVFEEGSLTGFFQRYVYCIGTSGDVPIIFDIVEWRAAVVEGGASAEASESIFFLNLS